MRGQRAEDFRRVIHVVFGQDPAHGRQRSVLHQISQHQSANGGLATRQVHSLVDVVGDERGVDEEGEPLAREKEEERDERVGDHFGENKLSCQLTEWTVKLTWLSLLQRSMGLM